MPRSSKRVSGGNSSKTATIVVVILAFAVTLIGLTLTVRENWSSPSRSGGRVSGSNPGLAPYGPHQPPFSEKQLLLPYPSYEYSLDAAHTNEIHSHNVPRHQRFYVKNRLGDPMYSVHPDLTVPSFAPNAEYRRVGIVYSANHPNLKLPLFGQPTVPGGNRFDYYVLDDSNHANPLPIDDHNGLELLSKDVVRVPGYSDDFKVYNYYDNQ